jgi:hypothetical protein
VGDERVRRRGERHAGRSKNGRGCDINRRR